MVTSIPFYLPSNTDSNVHGKGTVDAIISFCEKIYCNLHDEKHTLSVFVDLPKLFDKVNHQILIRKPFR